MADNKPPVPAGDKTECGCKADDDTCKCVDGKKVFIKIPSNG
jgi:hypothetical protein